VYSPGDRFRLQTVSGGVVHLQLGERAAHGDIACTLLYVWQKSLIISQVAAGWFMGRVCSSVHASQPQAVDSKAAATSVSQQEKGSGDNQSCSFMGHSKQMRCCA
jgi:hypothetical protein